MRIETDIKLGFKDVMIRPKRSTLKSRSQVSLIRKFNFLHSDLTWEGIPIMAANMDTVGTFEMAKALGDHKLFTTIHKHYSPEEWKDFYRVSENKDDADTQQYGVPSRIIRSPDSRKFGVSPIPDKVYRIWFYAYTLPTELDAFGDATVFPDVYKPVLLARARYFMHQFKENSQAAAFAMDDYKRGLKLMRLHLMEPTPGYFKDDRMRFV